jgi:glycosyltransferase involved in cell wall biosynthesis
MQVENSFCISLYNRYTMVDGDRVLHPVDTLMAGILAQKLESFEVVVVDFGSTDTDFCWLRQMVKRSILVTLQEPFNLGRARNLACHVATGKRLFVLDCDMQLPDNFCATLKPHIDAGKVCFPLYMLTHRNGKDSRPGQGWGNVAMLKSVFYALRENGVSWMQKTTYGAEDLSVANPIVQGGKAPYFREMVEGFRHIYHPRVGEWYSTAKKTEEPDNG